MAQPDWASEETLASRVGLSSLPCRYRCRDAACHSLRVVVCAQRSPRPSASHSRSVADRRRGARRRKPRRLPARWIARTSWRPRAPVRAGALCARRKAGCADAGRHHRGWACPTGSTRYTRRPLGGEVDEMALCGASGITGALRGFVSRPPRQWGSEGVRRAVEVGLALVDRRRWALGPNPSLRRIPHLRCLAGWGRSTDVYPRSAGSDGVVGSFWLVEGAGYGRSYPLAPPHY